MTVDDYLATLPAQKKGELERIRNIVLQAIPDAVEVNSYGMPGFTYKGRYLAGYNAWKDHFSFFPTAEPIEVLKDELTVYSLSRGTIRYNLDAPIPKQLIEALVRIRMATIDGGITH